MGNKISVHSGAGHANKSISLDLSIFEDTANQYVSGGYTAKDVAIKFGWSYDMARRNINKRLNDGSIRMIGYRIVGNTKYRVYETVKK